MALKYYCRGCLQLTVPELVLGTDGHCRCIYCNGRVRITGKPERVPILTIPIEEIDYNVKMTKPRKVKAEVKLGKQIRHVG
jgi:hypothetical protein